MPSLPIVKRSVDPAVATFLMNREDAPLALLDAGARFTAVNRAFEHLVGFSAARLAGRRWVDMLAPGDAKSTHVRLREAFRKRALQIELAVTTSVTRRVVLTAELHGIGKLGTLVVVISWSAADRDRTPLEVTDLVYEIELEDFGRLLWTRSDASPESPRPAKQQCHLVIYGRETPCKGCPALALTGGASDATSILQSVELEPLLVDARRVDADHARLNVRRISNEIFGKLVEARIEAIAHRGKLTERETEVVRLMLFGRSAREVSRALHISYSTAKFHQTNVLRKLDVETRLGLFRLLL